MKKLLSLSLLLGLSATSQADLLFGIYGGAGVWNAGVDGEIGAGDQPITASELGLDSNTNNVFYLAVEHPLPFIPNVRVQHTGVSSTGSANLQREFTLEDITFDANLDTQTEVDFSHTDLSLYYEVLDNYVSIDVGLTARLLDGFARVEATDPDNADNNISEEVDLNVGLPLLYGRAQIDLPFTGWFLGGTINYISLADNTLSDIEARVGYLSSGFGLDFGFEAGYRQIKLVADEAGDLFADVTVDGPYAELIFHF